MSVPKISDFDPKMGIFSSFEIKIRKNGVQNQKMPQFCVGTNNDFERNSKLKFTPVWYNISKGAFMKEIVLGGLNFSISNSYRIMKSRIKNCSCVSLFGEFSAKVLIYKSFLGAEIEFEIDKWDASTLSRIDDILIGKYGEPDYIAKGEMKIWKEKDFYIVHGMDDKHYQVDVHIVKICFIKPYFFMLDYEKYREYVVIFNEISEKLGLRWSGNLSVLDRQTAVLMDSEAYSYYFYFGKGKFAFYSSEKKKVVVGVRLVPSWNTKGKYKTIRELHIQLDSFFDYLKEYDSSLKVN